MRSEGGIGVGLMMGEPLGATVKAWDNRMNALQLGIAYSHDDYINFLGDYLWHMDMRQSLSLIPYVGTGAVIQAINANGARLRDHDASLDFGARFPLGVEWQSRSSHVGAFAELVPAVSFAPDWFLFLQGEAGLRLYL